MRGRKPELRIVDEPDAGWANPPNEQAADIPPMGGVTAPVSPDRPALPTAPDWLPIEGKDEWSRVIGDLVRRRLYVAADTTSIEMYCLAVAQVKQCQVIMASEPMFITPTTGTGMPRPHPALRTMNQCMAQARRYAAELGITPISRHRPGANMGQKDMFGGGDAWSEMDL
ncbi:phage terminase small subunit P27 family [Tardiphaga sp. vice352]|nr:phage terminase small subunit P27 family [Tardiphaga sp. vice278]QDM29974.1 phage terminase small subunit P27 family [Tardiphaga sp. vice352]